MSKREKANRPAGPEPVLKPYATPLEWLEGRRWADEPIDDGPFEYLGDGDETRLRQSLIVPAVVRTVRDWRREVHRRREELTRQAGVVLPLDEFVARHKLDALARDIIETLLLEATDIMDRMRMRNDASEVVRRLVRGRDLKTEALLPYLLPGSRLRRLVGQSEPWGLTLRYELVLELLGIETGAEPDAPPAAAVRKGEAGR